MAEPQRVTQLPREVVTGRAGDFQRVTQVARETMASRPSEFMRVTQVVREIVAKRPVVSTDHLYSLPQMGVGW